MKSVTKYRSKPKIVEAIQYTGKNFHKIKEFCEDSFLVDEIVIIDTSLGTNELIPSDYLVLEDNQFDIYSEEVFHSYFENLSYEI